MLFFGLSLTVMMTRPVVANDRTLAATTVAKFDHEEHLFWYWSMLIYQLLDAFFAGGGDFAINLFLYFIIICIEFVINLLGARLRRFGYEKMEMLTSNQAAIDHKMIAKLIKHHIEAGKLVRHYVDKS